MTAKTALLSLLLCLNGAFLKASPTALISTDGKTIHAEILGVKADCVVIKKGVKEFTVPRDRFSNETQEVFESWLENEKKNRIPKLEIDINSGKRDQNDKRDSFDDRKGHFQFRIKISNEEIGFDLSNATAKLSVIGKDCRETKTFGIMQKADFTFDVKEGETFEWKGRAKHYSFDNRPPAYWGVEYYGYVFQIKNESGTVLFTKAMPERFSEHIDTILKYKVEKAFDSKMNDRGKVFIRD